MRPRFVFSISPRLGLRNLFSSFFFPFFRNHLPNLSIYDGQGRAGNLSGKKAKAGHSS